MLSIDSMSCWSQGCNHPLNLELSEPQDPFNLDSKVFQIILDTIKIQQPLIWYLVYVCFHEPSLASQCFIVCSPGRVADAPLTSSTPTPANLWLAWAQTRGRAQMQSKLANVRATLDMLVHKLAFRSYSNILSLDQNKSCYCFTLSINLPSSSCRLWVVKPLENNELPIFQEVDHFFMNKHKIVKI